jgi:16S rRNA processing protein RimM
LSETTPGIDPEKAVAIGRIVAPHGIRGELKVEPLTDFPERFLRGARVWLKGNEHRIEASRRQQHLVYLKLSVIDTRTDAEALRGEELRVPAPTRIEERDVFYQHDIIGLRVEDEAGQALGRVDSIFSTGSNDVYVVRGEQGELLLPAVEDAIRQIDIAGGRIVIEMIPGLEFTRTAAPPPRRPMRRVRRPTSRGGPAARPRG